MQELSNTEISQVQGAWGVREVGCGTLDVLLAGGCLFLCWSVDQEGDLNMSGAIILGSVATFLLADGLTRIYSSVTEEIRAA